MNIVFISFFDSKNLGDLLITEVLEEKLIAGDNVKKYSFNIIPDDKFVNATAKPTVKRESFIKSIYQSFFRNLDPIDRIHSILMKKRIDNNQYLKTLENDIKKCDFLILGGGNAIFDLTKHSISYYKFYVILKIAKKYNKRVFITSIGLGPFKTQKQIQNTVTVLKQADYITVRDRKSFNYIEKELGNKAVLSIDPVFLLNKVKKNSTEVNKEKVISVCILDLKLNKSKYSYYKEYIQGFSKLIEKLHNNGYKVKLYSTEPRDYTAVFEVYNNLKQKNNIDVVEIKDFNDLINLYCKTDLIIGTRMHSLIIGISQYIPVIGLSWQDKVDEMFKMINMTDYVFSIDQLDENIPQILNLTRNTLKNRETKERLKELKSLNEKKFHINIDLLNNIRDEVKKEKKYAE